MKRLSISHFFFSEDIEILLREKVALCHELDSNQHLWAKDIPSELPFILIMTLKKERRERTEFIRTYFKKIINRRSRE